MLNAIKKMFSPPGQRTVEVPAIGKMWQRDDEWESELVFTLPDGAEVVMPISIPGDENGPFTALVIHVAQARERYADLLPMALQEILALQNVFLDADQVSEALEGPSLTIDAFQDGPIVWALQYTLDTDDDGDAAYFVRFTDWTLTITNVVA
ncbi:MAG: hypothetical protein ACI8W8_000252 [Rhodothermales bacterium]|jgi:hypothetical protein